MTDKAPRPRKSRREDGPDGSNGSSNNPGQDDPYSENDSSGYTEEDEAGYSEYMYGSGSATQYGVYNQQFDQYTNYSSYPPDVYQEFVYDQVENYDQQQQHYNYGNY
ncbi:hypothetical protein AA313_de0204104 [Arthrobotrys entomopaga]|nr:hypothetical protein AA313_de0204104 [Arthrobotrys entomopaga]